MASCKKEYVCQCGNEFIDVEGKIIKDTKKSASEKCENFDSEWKKQNSGGCYLYKKKK
jgi:hypothetical protein